MNTEEIQTLEIPLNRLLAWNDNPRITSTEEGVGELADSIASVGLLQGLVVKKEPRGKYAVIAGRRRLMALSQLASEGRLKPNTPVPCRVAPADADLPEISLAENVMRAPMHPADEFEAFQRLITAGKSAADVAARFGVTEAVVLRRIALARVNPALLAKYREGEINLEVLQAFTLTDDHSRQEEVWNQLHPWNRNAQTVRQMLAITDIPATDKRVRFVGLANYETNGGIIRRDLFADGEDGIYIADPAKLTRLVNERLQMLAEGVKQEGWKWVDVQPELDHQAVSRHRRLHAPELPLSADAQAEIAALDEKREALVDRLGVEGEGDDDTDRSQAIYDQIDEIDRRTLAVRRSRKPAYSDEAKAVSGVVVSLGRDGEPAFLYGLLRKEDERALDKTELTGGIVRAAAPDTEPLQDTPAYSAALIETLTQCKTAATAIELCRQPAVALAALVYTLVLQEFGLDLQLYPATSCLQVSTRQPFLEGAKNSSALAFLEQEKLHWLGRLPTTAGSLWTWCLERDQATLLQLLAYCVSRTVNAVKTKMEVDQNGSRLQHADSLAAALDFDLTKWFTPTAENFFLKVSKAQLAQALAEAGKPLSPELLKCKKAELAAIAENEIVGAGWLPQPIRLAARSNPDA